MTLSMQENKDPFLERQIDLNLNIGEGYGYNRDLIEEQLLPYATSVNVSSGAHAGDPAQIYRSIKRCKNFPNLVLGALISYPDLAGYGLRKIELSQEELRASIISQLGSVAALAKSHGYEIQHVRAHGYLYEQLLHNYEVAETVARAMQEFGNWLVLVGPTSSVLDEVSNWTNIRVAPEARIDLRYKGNGSLIAFDSKKDGDLELAVVAQRARDLIYKGVVMTEDSREHKLKFETISLPSMSINAVEIAKLVRSMVAKPLPLRSIDYEPYLSEFI